MLHLQRVRAHGGPHGLRVLLRHVALVAAAAAPAAEPALTSASAVVPAEPAAVAGSSGAVHLRAAGRRRSLRLDCRQRRHGHECGGLHASGSGQPSLGVVLLCGRAGHRRMLRVRLLHFRPPGCALLLPAL